MLPKEGVGRWESQGTQVMPFLHSRGADLCTVENVHRHTPVYKVLHLSVDSTMDHVVL